MFLEEALVRLQDPSECAQLKLTFGFLSWHAKETGSRTPAFL